MLIVLAPPIFITVIQKDKSQRYIGESYFFLTSYFFLMKWKAYRLLEWCEKFVLVLQHLHQQPDHVQSYCP
ncbi:hypothetical protein A3030_24195 [Salmonella enterica subsp. enterica serovar Senftenberg]|uniref:Uncharacterized protein n=1 Tax=Salmonella senftenberg TaxID=28150 RepID=A0A5Z6EJ70_SALSE|nr:hypothetical protein [Salmonella enterica subsp. enterica serovar Senftenberg]